MSIQGYNSLSQKERITWVDSAKGIAIYLIVVGHFLNVSSLELVNKAIYSFHIPLFFILSGYTHKESDRQFWKGIFDKAKQLLLPYIVYIILSVLFCMVYGNYELTWDKLCYYNASIYFDEPIWFLIVLFAVFVIEYAIKTVRWKPIFQMMTSLLLLAIGYICHKYKYGFASYINHFGLNRIIVCFSFFMLGVVFKQVRGGQVLKDEKVKYLFLIALSGLWLVSLSNNVKCSMYIFCFGNYWLFILSAITGSMAVALVCKRWLDFRLLRKLSKYGVFLMGTQYFWLIPVRDYLVSKEINKSTFYGAISFMIPCIGISITILTYELIKKKVPIIKILNGELR